MVYNESLFCCFYICDCPNCMACRWDDVCELYVCVNDMLLGEMVVLCAHIMCDVISESSYYNESTAMKPLFLLEI